LRRAPNASQKLLRRAPNASQELLRRAPNASQELLRRAPNASQELLRRAPNASQNKKGEETAEFLRLCVKKSGEEKSRLAFAQLRASSIFAMLFQRQKSD
jgi:hypothetical protein